MEKVRVGIIGFGRMGLTHYSIINTHPAVEMTAIADTSSTMLNMIKKYLPAVKMFEDYKDLLNSGLVDAVIICTPSILHYDACKLAGENGIAVMPYLDDTGQRLGNANAVNVSSRNTFCHDTVLVDVEIFLRHSLNGEDK